VFRGAIPKRLPWGVSPTPSALNTAYIVTAHAGLAQSRPFVVCKSITSADGARKAQAVMDKQESISAWVAGHTRIALFGQSSMSDAPTWRLQ
jgi:hypothetical protein